MKKVFLILAMACAALVSCNKENAENAKTPEELLLEKVQGKWACIHHSLYENQEKFENGIPIDEFA